MKRFILKRDFINVLNVYRLVSVLVLVVIGEVVWEKGLNVVNVRGFLVLLNMKEFILEKGFLFEVSVGSCLFLVIIIMILECIKRFKGYLVVKIWLL